MATTKANKFLKSPAILAAVVLFVLVAFTIFGSQGQTAKFSAAATASKQYSIYTPFYVDAWDKSDGWYKDCSTHTGGKDYANYYCQSQGFSGLDTASGCLYGAKGDRFVWNYNVASNGKRYFTKGRATGSGAALYGMFCLGTEAGPRPTMNIEAPTSGQTFESGKSIRFVGWSFAPGGGRTWETNPTTTLNVWINGQKFTPDLQRVARSDVCKDYPNAFECMQGTQLVGWYFDWTPPAATDMIESHKIEIEAINTLSMRASPLQKLYVAVNPAAPVSQSRSVTEVATPFAIDAWGVSGTSSAWTDCSQQDGGLAWANLYCKAKGYGSTATNGCYQQYAQARWTLADPNSASSGQGRYTGSGAAFTKVKCA